MDDLASILYPGEQVLASERANAVIRLTDHGLRAIANTAVAMSAVGLKGKEAIGGRLHLTNWRLVFRSHPFNRVKGQSSILLPTIVSLSDASRLVMRKIEITTHATAHEFVIWGVPAFIKAIESARAGADADEIVSAIEIDPRRLGGGLAADLATYRVMDAVARALQITTNPLDVANVLNVLELLELGGETRDRPDRPPER